MDTIYALATARGKAGVAIIRVSGDRSWDIAHALTGRLSDPTVARYAVFRDQSGRILDKGYVLLFERGRSFTGERIAEFHIHGSVAVINRFLEELSTFECRLSEPGEFTRRALENGVLDLDEVEGLADLIDAETEAQRRQAQRIFSGHLGKKAEGWRESLVRAMALLEVTIDFSDEEVPETVTEEVLALLRDVNREIEIQLGSSHAAERVRTGFEVAIVGEPNAGKSTLLNYLSQREAAITSEFAGTTRDVIEVRMDLGGYPVTFLDTAGLRETDDFVEKIGISRTIERAKLADMRLFLYDGVPFPTDLKRSGDIEVFGKADISEKGEISGVTGAGVEELIAQITQRLSEMVSADSVLTRQRHRAAAKTCLVALAEAIALLDSEIGGYELVLSELHTAAESLQSLVGKIGTEDLLDVIFSSFCLGK